jgi:yecA family protein
MPNSTQYKLLRTGSVRGGTLQGPRGGRSGRYGANTDILAPSIDEFGHQPFSQKHLLALSQRLQDPKWSRGSLNIFGLEGLLTALLVLPLGLRSGAWLPLVWNGSGWRIPLALQDGEQFSQFLESIAGYLRMIDRQLLAAPPHFESIVDTLPPRYRPKTAHALQDWARGFGLALSESNFSRVLPDSVTHRALYAIAMHAKPPAMSVHERSHASPSTWQQAVFTLAAARTSRGPLGALPASSFP